MVLPSELGRPLAAVGIRIASVPPLLLVVGHIVAVEHDLLLLVPVRGLFAASAGKVVAAVVVMKEDWGSTVAPVYPGHIRYALFADTWHCAHSRVTRRLKTAASTVFTPAAALQIGSISIYCNFKHYSFKKGRKLTSS